MTGADSNEEQFDGERKILDVIVFLPTKDVKGKINILPSTKVKDIKETIIEHISDMIDSETKHFSLRLYYNGKELKDNLVFKFHRKRWNEFLEDGSVSPEFIEMFEKNGIEVPENFTISKSKKYGRWWVNTGVKRRFVIEMDEEEHRIYDMKESLYEKTEDGDEIKVRIMMEVA